MLYRLLLICTITLFSNLLALGQNEFVKIEFHSQVSFAKLQSEALQNGSYVAVYWPQGAFIRINSTNEMSWIAEFTSEVKIQSLFANDWFDSQLATEETWSKFQCGNSSMDEHSIETNHFRNKGLTDRLEGHTVCALFMLNHIGGIPWSNADEQSILQNTAVNLLWWSEQAALHGVQKSFEIVPYFANDPVCQIRTDPTASGSAWLNEVLTSLGFTSGSTLEREIEFTRNVITEKESDWGFMAYILRGSNTYRSNAGIFGPSTRIAYNAALNGFTTAHEVGHIFGLQDEYEERAPIAFNYVLNDLPNLNADFRNPVNAPCMMKATNPHLGLCAFNAYHLFLTEALYLTEVVTNPEDALFMLEYINPQGIPIIGSRLFQGRQIIPMGLGTRMRLRGLPQIKVNSGSYSNPQWTNGSNPLIHEVNTTDNTLLLFYDRTGDADQFVQYLRFGEFFTGKRFTHLEMIGDTLFTLSDQAISAYTSSDLKVFDKWKTPRPGESDSLWVYRMGRALYQNKETGSVFIGGREGNTLAEIIEIKTDGQVNSYTPPSSFRTIGFYQGVVQAANQKIFATFSEGGLHVYEQGRDMQMLTDRDGLPQNQVFALARDYQNRIWLGVAADRSGQGRGGVYLINPVTMQITQGMDVPDRLRNAEIRKIKTYNDGKVLLFIGSQEFFLMRDDNQVTRYTVQSGNITDVDWIEDERFAVATNQGIFYTAPDGIQRLLTVETHRLQENFCNSVLALPNEVILTGHNNGGITALYLGENLSTATRNEHKKEALQIFPNPVTGDRVLIHFPEFVQGPIHIEWLTLSGSQVDTQIIYEMNDTQITATVPNHIKAGIYLIRVSAKNRTKSGLLRVDNSH